MPFYVSPEQSMRDKADYARKGVARSRSSVVLQYSGGILMVSIKLPLLFAFYASDFRHSASHVSGPGWSTCF